MELSEELHNAIQGGYFEKVEALLGADSKTTGQESPAADALEALFAEDFLDGEILGDIARLVLTRGFASL